MTKKIQTSKNIDLTQKFIEYLLKGDNVPNLPENISFVPFSKNDIELNKANEELLESLIKDKNPVAKVEEPTSSKEAWKITPVNF